MRKIGMNPALACSIALCCVSFALNGCVAVLAQPEWSSAPGYEYPYVGPAPYVVITPGWNEEHEEWEHHHHHHHRRHEDHDLF